jgi:hypothetical protein
MSALARWDAFLAQIEQRHGEVIVAAEVAARAFIASVASGGDVIPLSHQLMAVEARLQALESNIIDTWHAKVDDAILEEGHGVAARDAAYARGEALKDRLYDAREELSPRLHAELARLRFDHALASTRDIYCRFCGAAGPRPLSFRALELRCATCQASTVFDPGELMRSVAAVGTHALAQVAANAEWRAMRIADRRARRIRPPVPLAAIVASEQSQIAYWRRYLAARATFEPELARDPSLEIRSRMEQWYVSHAEYEEEWVRAGRPRTPV